MSSVLKMAAVVAVVVGLAAVGLGVSSSVVLADGAADRCFGVHRFGQQPVDVAKSGDGSQVLAQARWGYHDSIGCYLVLDDTAVGVLRASGRPVSSGATAGDGAAAERCFGAHHFGRQPVDVAKSADGSVVLAQVRWGFHDSIGCNLVLDDGAVGVLRTGPPAPAPQPSLVSADGSHSCLLLEGGAAVCWGSDQYGQADAPAGLFLGVSAGWRHSCGLRTDGAAVCWGSDEYG